MFHVKRAAQALLVGGLLSGAALFAQAGPDAPPLYLETVWSFTRGPDVISVEAGVIRGDNLPWDPGDPHRNVSVPGLGHGQAVVRSDGADLRFPVASGQFVRVRGTVPESALLKYARQLKLH